jgi:UDP-N-acetylglucosamine:LPS N-acetylglucosamine transferase
MDTETHKKILAISSPGGHWVQLCRLLPVFSTYKVIYACTYDKPTELNDNDKYYVIGDISRDTITRIFNVIGRLLHILKNEKPTHVITTGALPGLITICLARIMGSKTIWLDSIANSEKVSLSGKIASYLSTNCFTQWEHLANNRIKYIGRIV